MVRIGGTSTCVCDVTDMCINWAEAQHDGAHIQCSDVCCLNICFRCSTKAALYARLGLGSGHGVCLRCFLFPKWMPVYHCFLVQHCLAGWEMAKPSVVPPQSSIDLKSALSTRTGSAGTKVPTDSDCRCQKIGMTQECCYDIIVND